MPAVRGMSTPGDTTGCWRSGKYEPSEPDAFPPEGVAFAFPPYVPGYPPLMPPSDASVSGASVLPRGPPSCALCGTKPQP